jgi:hypothetical protein
MPHQARPQHGRTFPGKSLMISASPSRGPGHSRLAMRNLGTSGSCSWPVTSRIWEVLGSHRAVALDRGIISNQGDQGLGQSPSVGTLAPRMTLPSARGKVTENHLLGPTALWSPEKPAGSPQGGQGTHIPADWRPDKLTPFPQIQSLHSPLGHVTCWGPHSGQAFSSLPCCPGPGAVVRNQRSPTEVLHICALPCLMVEVCLPQETPTS